MEPLILRRVVPVMDSRWSDAPTDTDPLPATVTISADGQVNEQATRLTEVKQETTDDQ